MEKIILFDYKKIKYNDNSILEIDALDLENLSNLHDSGEFIDLPSKKIGNKTLLEWFSIGDISYWWLISTVIYPKFREAVNFINRFLNLIQKYHPKIIKLEGFFDKYEIIRDICLQNNVKLKVNSEKKIIFDLRQKIINYSKSFRYKKILKEKETKRKNIFNSYNSFNIPPKNFTLVTGIDRRIQVLTNDGSTKKQDFIIQPIIDIIKKTNLPLLCIDLDYTSHGKSEYLIERLETDVNWIPLEIITNSNFDKDIKEKISILKSNINKMLQYDMNSFLVYRNISLWNTIKQSFSDIFLDPYLPYLLNLEKNLELFLIKNKPDVIIQVYEVGSFAKIFEIVASRLNIKTIGIQHGGMLNETQYDYMHKEIRNLKNPLGNPISNQTFVFGEYYKEILSKKGHYPSSSIVVTGNPNWHNVENLKKILNRKNILSKFEISDKKIILIPLSFRIAYAKKNQSDRLILDTIYSAFGKNDDFVILVRPHPGDEFDQTILDNLYPNSNFKCSTGSLFEELFISDIVIVTYSTVGLEAALFEKPVLYVNLDTTNNSPLYGKIPSLMIENKLALETTLQNLSNSINLVYTNSWKYNSDLNRDTFLKYILNYNQKVDFISLIYSGIGD